MKNVMEVANADNDYTENVVKAPKHVILILEDEKALRDSLKSLLKNRLEDFDFVIPDDLNELKSLLVDSDVIIRYAILDNALSNWIKDYDDTASLEINKFIIRRGVDLAKYLLIGKRIEKLLLYSSNDTSLSDDIHYRLQLKPNVSVLRAIPYKLFGTHNALAPFVCHLGYLNPELASEVVKAGIVSHTDVSKCLSPQPIAQPSLKGLYAKLDLQIQPIFEKSTKLSIQGYSFLLNKIFLARDSGQVQWRLGNRWWNVSVNTTLETLESEDLSLLGLENEVLRNPIMELSLFIDKQEFDIRSVVFSKVGTSLKDYAWNEFQQEALARDYINSLKSSSYLEVLNSMPDESKIIFGLISAKKLARQYIQRTLTKEEAITFYQTFSVYEALQFGKEYFLLRMKNASVTPDRVSNDLTLFLMDASSLVIGPIVKNMLVGRIIESDEDYVTVEYQNIGLRDCRIEVVAKDSLIKSGMAATNDECYFFTVYEPTSGGLAFDIEPVDYQILKFYDAI